MKKVLDTIHWLTIVIYFDGHFIKPKISSKLIVELFVVLKLAVTFFMLFLTLGVVGNIVILL